MRLAVLGLVGFCMTMSLPAWMTEELSYVQVEPPTVDVFIGDLLNLTCTLINDTFNSSSLYFTKRFPRKDNSHLSKFIQKKIDQQYVKIVDEKTIYLQYPVSIPEVDEEQFQCKVCEHLNKCLNWSVVRLHKHTGAIMELTCLVDSWSSMTCNWILPPILPDTKLDVQLKWGINEQRPTEPCPDMVNLTTCSWPSNQFNITKVYTILLTISTLSNEGKELESKVSDPFIIRPRTLVKPPPVTNVKVTNQSPSCVMLSWQQPTNHDLICQVLYNCSSLQEECEVVEGVYTRRARICHLLPWTVYDWSVSCLPVSGGTYSDEVSITSKTAMGAPTVAPEVTAGGFADIGCPEARCRIIKFYWQTIPEELRSGPLSSYNIIATDDQGNWMTYRVTDPTQTSWNVTLRDDKNYRIQITGCSSEGGCSASSDSVVVTAPGHGIYPPQDFVVELVSDTDSESKSDLEPDSTANPDPDAAESDPDLDPDAESDSTYYNISWSAVPPAVAPISYTLYWCRGTFTECKTPLDWVTLSPNITSYNLTFPNLTKASMDEYTVGISVEAPLPGESQRSRRSTGPVISSGIQWSPCLYGPPQVPTSAPANVRKVEEPSSDSVAIAWDTFLCENTPSVLTGVLIEYCPVSGCKEPKTVMAPGTAVSYTITGLAEGAAYTVVLKPVSAAGIGPASEPITVGVSPWPGMKLLYIALITAGVLVLVLLMAFLIIWALCKAKKTTKYEVEMPKEEPMDIEEADMSFSAPPPPPPLTEAPTKNGSTKQKQAEKDKSPDNEELLDPEGPGYGQHPSPRLRESSAPGKGDNLYMLNAEIRKNQRMKRFSDTSVKEPEDIPGLPRKTDQAFQMQDFVDEGVDKDRHSSFKGQLPARGYGFNHSPDYEDMVNNEQEKDSSPLISKSKKKGKKDKRIPYDEIAAQAAKGDPRRRSANDPEPRRISESAPLIEEEPKKKKHKKNKGHQRTPSMTQETPSPNKDTNFNYPEPPSNIPYVETRPYSPNVISYDPNAIAAPNPHTGSSNPYVITTLYEPEDTAQIMPTDPNRNSGPPQKPPRANSPSKEQKPFVYPPPEDIVRDPHYSFPPPPNPNGVQKKRRAPDPPSPNSEEPINRSRLVQPVRTSQELPLSPTRPPPPRNQPKPPPRSSQEIPKSPVEEPPKRASQIIPFAAQPTPFLPAEQPQSPTSEQPLRSSIVEPQQPKRVSREAPPPPIRHSQGQPAQHPQRHSQEQPVQQPQRDYQGQPQRDSEGSISPTKPLAPIVAKHFKNEPRLPGPPPEPDPEPVTSPPAKPLAPSVAMHFRSDPKSREKPMVNNVPVNEPKQRNVEIPRTLTLERPPSGSGQVILPTSPTMVLESPPSKIPVADKSRPKTPTSPGKRPTSITSITVSEHDKDTLDISLLVGEILGEGLTVKRPQNQNEEVTMRPKPQNQERPDSGGRQSKTKSNPPKIAPKPKSGTYSRLSATSPTSPTGATQGGSSYVKMTST